MNLKEILLLLLVLVLARHSGISSIGSNNYMVSVEISFKLVLGTCEVLSY